MPIKYDDDITYKGVLLDYSLTNPNKGRRIRTVADLPTKVGNKYPLLANTEYFIDTYILSLGVDYLELNEGTSLRGASSFNTIMSSTNATGAIQSVDANISVSFLTISAPRAFNLVNTDKTKKISLERLGITAQTSASIINGYYIQYLNVVNWFSNTVGCLTASNQNQGIYINQNFDNTNTGTFFTVTPVATSDIAINSCYFEVSAGKTGLNVSAATINSGLIRASQFVGVGGTRITGINANNAGWSIPANGNVGIAGLFVTNRTIVLGTLASTTSGTWLSVTQQVLTRGTITDYEPSATLLKATLSVGITHDTTGGSVGFRLFNLTDNAVVAGSTVTPIIIATGGVFQVETSAEFDLLPSKEYRVQIIKNSGGGATNVIVNAGDLTIKAF